MSSSLRRSLGVTPFNRNTGIDTYMPPSPRSSLEDISSLSSSSPGRQSPLRSLSLSDEPVPLSFEEEDISSTSFSGLVQGHSLEEELSRSGYSPISKMVVVSPQGEKQVKFVKAQTSLGEPLYVSIDVDDAYVSQSPQDTHFRPSKVSMNVPYEEKQLAFEQVGEHASGVAFECGTGLCAVHKHHHAPKEENFVLMSATKKTEESFVYASFPLVKMSEIRRNPEGCQKNLDKCMRKYRDAALEKCLCDIQELQKKFKCLCTLFDQTMKCKAKVIQEYKRTMNLLECEYAKCDPCVEKNKCRMKEIKYNIEKRNELFPYLLESCQEVCSLKTEVSEATKVLSAAKCRLEKKFKYISCVYQPKKHKTCKLKCAWERSCGSDSDSDDEY